MSAFIVVVAQECQCDRNNEPHESLRFVLGCVIFEFFSSLSLASPFGGMSLSITIGTLLTATVAGDTEKPLDCNTALSSLPHRAHVEPSRAPLGPPNRFRFSFTVSYPSARSLARTAS